MKILVQILSCIIFGTTVSSMGFFGTWQGFTLITILALNIGLSNV